MRTFITAIGLFAVALPVSVAVPTSSAEARRTYHGQSTRNHHKRCRYSSGTTGLVAGGVGGALVGRSVLGGGLLGTAAGGVAGALGGRAIDRSMTAKRRCR